MNCDNLVENSMTTIVIRKSRSTVCARCLKKLRPC